MLKSGILRRGHWYIGKYPGAWYMWSSSKNKVVKSDQWGPFKSVSEAKAERGRLIRRYKK